MKLARVFYQDFDGRSAGDIHDVIDSENHPGSILSHALKEFEVDEDFDKDRDKVTLHQAKWTKAEGEEVQTVYEDPEDESWTHHTAGPYLEVTKDDADLVAAAEEADKEAQIGVKYDEMTEDVLAEMQALFGTTRTDSAQANHETWKLMAEKPELFSGEGLVATKDAGPYSKGDALDSDTKVSEWATAMIGLVEAYGVSRVKRMKQFADEKAAILAGS